MKEQKKGRKLKRPYRVLRVLYRMLVVLSVLVVGLYLVLQFVVQAPKQQVLAYDGPEGEETTGVVTPTGGQKQRKELCYTILLAAKDGESGNSDTIMVAMYDVPNQTVGLVSIPRDTAVYTERNTPKINSAYPFGVDRLRSEVSDLLGIPIDFYVTLDMEAFVKIVDAVGGIDFDVPLEMYHHDPLQDLTIRYMPGMQHLDGQQTLEVARFRNNPDGTGYAIPDVGRTQTQQKIIKNIAGKIISWNSVTKVTDFVNIFNEYVDTDISLSDMVYFATRAVSVDLENGVQTATMPGDGTKRVNGVSNCYVYYPDEALAIINELINPYTTEMTLEDVHFIPLED